MRTSKKICNAVRRDQNPTVAQLIARRQGETAEKREIRHKAENIQQRLSGSGVTWAACVQAVKTNWLPQLLNKYR